MTRLPLGARLVRGLSRAALFLYPSGFRRLHGRWFPDVAVHIWQREAAGRSPFVATIAATSVLATDTIAAATSSWMAAVTGESEDAPSLGGVLRGAGRWVRDGGRELKLAARASVRRPAVSLLVCLTLGLGVGASTAAYDALDRAILNALPFAGGERLRYLGIEDRMADWRTSPPLEMVARIRAESRTVEAVEIYTEQLVTRLGDTADVIRGFGISAGLPAMLDIRPVEGRMLGPADAADGAPSVVMLTEPFWQREYGGAAEVIGRTLTLSNGPATIVGIWPAGARLSPRTNPDVIRVLPAGREYRRGSLVYVLARLAPGATDEQAIAELSTFLAAMPNPDPDDRPALDSQAFNFLGKAYINGVWLVFGGSLALLAAALASAVAILVERVTARSHEFGLRRALGGTGARIVRLFLAEGLIYAAGGLAIGAGVAVGLERLVQALEPRLFSEVAGAGLGGRALGFLLGSAVLVTLVCALAPLSQVRRADIRHVIARGSSGRGSQASLRLHMALVGAQAALAVLLVSGAALMLRSYVNLSQVDSGVDIERLAELSVSLPAARYPTPEAQRAFHARVRDALVSQPGVEAVTTSGMPILQASIQSGLPRLEGEETVDAPEAVTILTSAPPDYFRVMGIRLLAGRYFEPGERNLAIVNEAFAKSRGRDVIGKRVHTPMSRQSYEIVGIVNDTQTFGLADRDVRFNIYMPTDAHADSFARYIVRTAGDPGGLLQAARAKVAELDRALPLLMTQTGLDVLRRQTAEHRFVATLTGGLAVLGVVLALANVYGAVALSLSRRTREVGIRMALGATRASLARLLAATGLRPVVAGGVLGVTAAWFTTPYLDALLFQVPARDPMSAGLAIALVVAAAGLAAVVPARRASRVDPVITLRAE